MVQGMGRPIPEEPSLAFLPPKMCLSFLEGELDIVFEPGCVGGSLLFPRVSEKQQSWGHGAFAFHASPVTPGVWLWASVFVGNDRLTAQSGPTGHRAWSCRDLLGCLRKEGKRKDPV